MTPFFALAKNQLDAVDNIRHRSDGGRYACRTALRAAGTAFDEKKETSVTSNGSYDALNKRNWHVKKITAFFVISEQFNRNY